VTLALLAPGLRVRLAAIAAVLALIGCGYLFWVRDWSLFRVENVTVTGLTTSEADRVAAALESAARGMTTLHVSRERLDQAAAGFPVVRSLEVRADFPSGLRVHVLEHRPVARVVSGDSKVPVAADGSLLRGLPVAGRLPVIDVERALPAERLTDADVMRLVRVAAAAPGPLRRRVEHVGHERERGIVVQLAEGPEVIFGSAAGSRAKWIAATRVLADSAARGATYVDVRLPGRPAAGGLAAATVEPVTPAGEAAVLNPQP
jgi:cell division protein FtsQ